METRQMEKELQLTQRFLNFFKILILVRIVFRNSKRLNLKSLQEFKFPIILAGANFLNS